MARIAAVIIASLLAALAFAGEQRAARFAVPAAQSGEACVAPVAEMRRDHMKMLLHQRDGTVHEGLRAPRFSLKNCIACHASRKTGSVLGKDGFCAACHEYASVRIDCFECHSPLRQGGAVGVRQ